MPNEATKTEAPAEGAKLDLDKLSEPAPKGEAGAPSAEGNGTPARDAKGSATSSSPTDDLDAAIERAAKIERANALKQQDLDRKLKETEDLRASTEKQKAAYDEGLAKQAKLMLASEKLTKGEKVAALKEFMGDAWNAAEFMELVALEFPAAEGEGGGKKDDKPLPEQINELIDAREKKKAEEAAEAQRKADEAKKAEDDKKAADERSGKVARYKQEAVASIDAEITPLLKAQLDRWVDDLGEKKAKELMEEKLMTLFYDVYTGHKKALDPDQVAELAEHQLKKKATPTRTPMELIDREADEMDRERQVEERRSSVVHREDVKPKKKAREEMTALELVMEEADEHDKRAGRTRANESY